MPYFKKLTIVCYDYCISIIAENIKCDRLEVILTIFDIIIVISIIQNNNAHHHYATIRIYVPLFFIRKKSDYGSISTLYDNVLVENGRSALRQ